jgi:hypothetical protein
MVASSHPCPGNRRKSSGSPWGRVFEKNYFHNITFSNFRANAAGVLCGRKKTSDPVGGV